jgi:hypothetical protein
MYEEQPYANSFQKYMCVYTFNGSKWLIDIPAKSWEEAEERLIAISKGTVEGEVEAEIPAFQERLHLVS